MALDTYTNLQAEVALWLNRQDLTARIPTFVALLEAQVNRQLRVSDMETRSTSTLAADGQFLALPSDYLQLLSVQLNDTIVQPLRFASLIELDEIRRNNGNVAGRPIAYSIVGDELEFAPTADAEYEVEIVYRAQIPALATAVGDTNWALVKHPDLYLYGTLMQAAPYLHNDERVGIWSTALNAILEEIRLADERGRASGSPLISRIKPYGGALRARRRL